MLCKLQNTTKWCLEAVFLPTLFLNILAAVWAPMAMAQVQVSSPEQKDGTISGTVLLKAGNRPASQVAVKLKSHAAGIFRSVLTDLEGHFEVGSLPPSTYEIVVEEPGYQPAETSAHLDGSSSKLVLYLNSSSPAQPARNSVSARELKIPWKARNEFEKGVARLAKKDRAESLSHFAKAAQAFPEFYEAYYQMGVVETSLRRLDNARQAFQKSIDLSGGKYAWAEIGIGYLSYLEGKPEEAITIIQRALEKEESSPEAYFILGMALLRLNRLDEAERSAREALLRNPNYADAYLVLSDAYGRRHEYGAQLQGLDAYLKLEPKGAESEHVRVAREAVLRIQAKVNPQE
jgi:tetratricopeptide (TPR) repeat protein